MIKSVIFDIDDTMYDYSRGHRLAMEALKSYCIQNLQITGATFHKALREGDQLAVKRIAYPCAAIHNRLIRYQCMLELLGISVFPHAAAMCQIYWETLISDAEPQPGLLDFLRFLREKGIRIGVGTNMTAYVQFKKLEQLNITSMIDWILTSEEAGVEKPNPLFFQYCVEKSRCLPEECLFIGDSLEHDIEGASQSGLQALWYYPEKRVGMEVSNKYQLIRSFQECMETWS